MENSVIIKLIVDNLTANIDRVVWGEFVHDWKNRNSPDYKKKLLNFRYELQKLAGACNIRAYNNGLYLFTGEIWELLCPPRSDCKILYTALFNFMKSVGINEPFGNLFFKQNFVMQLYVLNLLTPKFNEIAFSNGVLDVYTGVLSDFSPNFHVIHKNKYKYNPKANCPLFKAFIKQVLPDKNSRRILQMFLGLGLIERSTVYDEYDGKNGANVELCLMLVGTGRNGKSTLCNVVKGVYGIDRVSDSEYDDIIHYGDEGMRSRAKLNGMVFNICQDVSQNSFGRNTGMFKKLVSCERTDTRGIGENVQSMHRIPYFIFCMNALPDSKDASLGFIRRLQYISFDYIIPAEQVNPELNYELSKEYSGIFNWLLRGARELRKRKFSFPTAEGSKRLEVITKFRINPVASWVDAYGAWPGPSVEGELYTEIKGCDLRDSINKFLKDNGRDEEISIQTFGAAMKELGFRKRRYGTSNVYMIYRCKLEDIKKPFCIDDEEFRVNGIMKDEFISEDD